MIRPSANCAHDPVGNRVSGPCSGFEFQAAQRPKWEPGPHVGTFIGQTVKNTPGIDGFPEGVPVNLKQLNSSRLGTLFKTVTLAAEQAENARYAGVELFVEAKAFSAKELLSDSTILPRIGSVIREETLSAVNILSADGWIRVVR